MSIVKKSLEENMEFIRSQLPDALKEHAEQCLDNCEIVHDNDELLEQQILQDLPDEVKAEATPGSILTKSEPIPSLSEQKSMVLKALPEEFKADFEKNAENELVG